MKVRVIYRMLLTQTDRPIVQNTRTPSQRGELCIYLKKQTYSGEQLTIEVISPCQPQTNKQKIQFFT